MKLQYASEIELCHGARDAAQRWRELDLSSLIVGLSGDLGSGKTTWVRALLSGLGHTGRVPSPTFTLLEHYEIGSLTVVHLDLYRLAEAGELEYLGLRDWLARPGVWLLVEWPERGGSFGNSLDLAIGFAITAVEGRQLTVDARTDAGAAAAGAWIGPDFNSHT